MNKSVNDKKCCTYCANCLPIGEGDHVCMEFEGEAILVMENYQRTDNFNKCNGTMYEED